MRRGLAALSDRVRKEEIWAFVEIPGVGARSASTERLRYYSNHPAYRTLPGWISNMVNREIVNRRFREADVDRALVGRLTRRVDMSELGLLQRDTSGAIKAAAPIDKVRTIAIPVGMMMILLFSVMSGAPQLLNSVIEEKDEPDQRSADRIGHALRADDGQARRLGGGLGAARRRLRGRRPHRRQSLRLRRRRPAAPTSRGCCCSC
jgi:hypothetical protein